MTRQHTPLSQRLAHTHGLGLSASPAKRIRTFHYPLLAFGAHLRVFYDLMSHICAVDPTRGGPQYKSPLGLKLQAKRGTSRLSRRAPVLPTILEEDEDVQEASGELFGRKSQNYNFAGIKAKARGLSAQLEGDDDLMEWDEETTLVALLRDECAIFTLI